MEPSPHLRFLSQPPSEKPHTSGTTNRFHCNYEPFGLSGACPIPTPLPFAGSPFALQSLPYIRSWTLGVQHSYFPRSASPPSYPNSPALPRSIKIQYILWETTCRLLLLLLLVCPPSHSFCARLLAHHWSNLKSRSNFHFSHCRWDD